MKKHRESLEVANVAHANPIPMGARVGNMIFSSGISGKNPETGELPSDVALQARFAFQNMRTLVENGGGKLGDIGHVTVFIKNESARSSVNEQWKAYFPVEDNRPARHSIISDLPSGMLVQLEIIAVLEE